MLTLGPFIYFCYFFGLLSISVWQLAATAAAGDEVGKDKNVFV